MPDKPPRLRPRRAVVLGASMAGLCAARVLSEHFADVLVLDRDARDPLTLKIEGIPKFRAAPGIHRGSKAVRVLEAVEKPAA